MSVPAAFIASFLQQSPKLIFIYSVAQRKEWVQQLVTWLPAHYAWVVRLRYFDELQYEEIAGLLALPLGTVKAQLFRALLRPLVENIPGAL